MKNIEDKKEDIIKSFERRAGSSLLEAGIKKVIAGVSGGADSVALLRVLHSIGVDVLAVHCNFGLRGEESERDQRFVENLCEELCIPLDMVRFNVQEYMARKGVSLEMACRELRYAYFRDKLCNSDFSRIVVAHNADDNAETVLLNLFRGSGIAGLRGMKPDTGEVMRPLLGISRGEIEEYLEALKQNFITDSSNLSSDYRRNFIRNEVIPLLETRWPSVRKSLNKTASIMAEEERGIEAALSPMLTSDTLKYESIQNPDQGKWLLRRFVTDRGGSDFIVEEIWRMIRSGEIRIGARWRGDFLFTRKGLEWVAENSYVEEEEMACKFCWDRFPNTAELREKIRKERDNSVLWINLSPDRLLFRHPVKGEKMRPLGMEGSKSVSKILKESLYSESERRNAVVVSERDSGEILWIEGIKRSGRRLITPEDEYIWKVERKKE